VEASSWCVNSRMIRASLAGWSRGMRVTNHHAHSGMMGQFVVVGSGQQPDAPGSDQHHGAPARLLVRRGGM
jgi:hypothetical protein